MWHCRLTAGLLTVFVVLLAESAIAAESTDQARSVAQLVHTGEWELAAEGARIALQYQMSHRRAPDAVPAAILLAPALTLLDRHAEALRLLAPLGSRPAVVAARGTILLDQGDYQGATKAFTLALQDPVSLPRVTRARVTCERAYADEQTGDTSAAAAGYLESLKLYAAAGHEQTFFMDRPRVSGTLWDPVAPQPIKVPGPVGDVITELDALGEPNAQAGYYSEAFSAYLEEEYLDSYPRAGPFVDCLVRVAQYKEATGEKELAHAILQTAIAQASVLEGLGYTYRPALVFSAYFEFLERANFEPKRLDQMAQFALFAAGQISPAYSEGDIRSPTSPTSSPRMRAYQALEAVRLRSLFRSGEMSDSVRDEAFVVAQDYQSSIAALAVHRHSEGRVHPRDPAVFTKAEHKAFWEQFDRDTPNSAHLSEFQLKPGQLFLMISPGAGTGAGRIWAQDTQGTVWAALGTDRETLRTDIETLRCSLDVKMCCTFPANSRMGAAYRRLKDAYIAEYNLDSVEDCPLQEEDFEASVAYRVFDEIFADSTIRGMASKAEELIIVPQGELASVPFGALPFERPRAGRGPVAAASTKWLGLEKAIQIYPSVNSYLEANVSEQALDKIRLFGVGDPTLGDNLVTGRKVDCTQFTPRSRRDRGESFGDPMRALAPLPGTRCELLAMSKLKGVASNKASRVLLWESATETGLRAASRTKRSMNQAEVLVFATHGLMRGDFGLKESALVLSRPRLKGPTHSDSFLTLSEIMQLQLKARLAILSACNTGSSGDAAGDALAGFATAFFRAGAESVLLSQWTVRDDVAAFVTPRIVALMMGDPTIKECERGGQADRNAAEAMRMALCEARRSQALVADLPGDWAPFVLVGGRSKL